MVDFDTEPEGITRVRIPFDQLRPTVRANPVTMPLSLSLKFNPARVSQIQILHSRFSDAGSENPGFRAGPLRLLVRRIEAVP